jgi:hypothetical protein
VGGYIPMVNRSYNVIHRRETVQKLQWLRRIGAGELHEMSGSLVEAVETGSRGASLRSMEPHDSSVVIQS